jgi:hypothetical protein
MDFRGGVGRFYLFPTPITRKSMYILVSQLLLIYINFGTFLSVFHNCCPWVWPFRMQYFGGNIKWLLYCNVCSLCCWLVILLLQILVHVYYHFLAGFPYQKINHSERIEQDIINLRGSSCKVPIILVRF